MACIGTVRDAYADEAQLLLYQGSVFHNRSSGLLERCGDLRGQKKPSVAITEMQEGPRPFLNISPVFDLGIHAVDPVVLPNVLRSSQCDVVNWSGLGQ